MTEAEWLEASDPHPMLEFVRHQASARKLRLFQVACCRRIWQFISDPGSRAIVEILERAADSPVDVREVLALPYDWLTDDCGGPGAAERHAYMTAGHVGFSLLGPIHGVLFPSDDWQDAVSAADGCATTAADARDLPRGDEFLRIYQGHMAAEQTVQCDLLRDLFGTPFRPAVVGARSRTTDVVGLARAIYEDRTFDRMPILADALMDAGCTDDEVIGHCRGGWTHVRGCWVIDLVLGKS
jgi:hypothetical protein